MVEVTFFIELSVVMLFVLGLSLIANKIKQPLLVAYILTGILAGPLFFNVISFNESYEIFSHIGVALLLFIVGLNLNISLIKEVGFISLITGIGQIVFTSVIGFAIGIALGFSVISAGILAIGLTFSSTIIIVKLLSDKKDIDTLYGKISMGFLLVQDLVAVLILMFISSLLNFEGGDISITLLKTIVFAIITIFVIFFLGKYLLSGFMEKVAKNQEIFFIFIIAWCFSFSALFDFLGFSTEIGALVAGILLASSRFQHEISAKVRPLRDFFIVIFFILLGSQIVIVTPELEMAESIGERLSIVWGDLQPLFLPSLLFSFFVLIGNPIIVLLLMTWFGYSSRTGFLAGLTVAQISEFSLILGILAKDAGFLTNAEVSLLTFVGIITITVSTYMIMHGERLYNLFAPLIRKLERKGLKDKRQGVQGKKYDIVIFGYDRIGSGINKILEKTKKNYLIVDSNPSVIRRLENKNMNCIYGDAGNVEFLSEFDFKDASLILSTVPDFEANFVLVENFRSVNKLGVAIVTANTIDNALELYRVGADYVIMPHYLGGDFVAGLIDEHSSNGFREFFNEKIKHVNTLKERKKQGVENIGRFI